MKRVVQLSFTQGFTSEIVFHLLFEICLPFFVCHLSNSIYSISISGVKSS